MGEERKLRPMLATYVCDGERWYNVSTINRFSSAMAAEDLAYAETLVWEWDDGKRERGNIVWQGSYRENDITEHQRVVAAIFAGGIAALEEKED